MHTAIIGASKGCGYHAALDILRDPSNTVTLLLRHPEGISSDPKFTSFIQEGRVKLVQGDATVEDDVSELFNCDKVDLLISTIGGQPHFGITTGYYIDSPVCTHFGLVLCNILASRPDVRPRVVITSTMGILGSYDCMPLFHRMFYKYLLRRAHCDKVSYEHIFQKAAKHFPTPALDHDLVPQTITQEQYDAVPANLIEQLIIVRPAVLVDGEADGKCQAGEQDTVSTATRGDVGRFIADECVPGKDAWVNKAVIVGK